MLLSRFTHFFRQFFWDESRLHQFVRFKNVCVTHWTFQIIIENQIWFEKCSNFQIYKCANANRKANMIWWISALLLGRSSSSSTNSTITTRIPQAKFTTNASSATWWPKLELIQVKPLWFLPGKVIEFVGSVVPLAMFALEPCWTVLCSQL